MIYGANGYTGRLIAEQARAGDLAPLLAGRGRVRSARWPGPWGSKRAGFLF